MVVNSHNVGFKMIMNMFDSFVYSGGGVEWLVQPVL